MPERLLLVDLHGADTSPWETVLADYGFQVSILRDGSSVPHACGRLKPDLVLLFEPQMREAAHEVGRAIKDDPTNRLTPVAVIGPSHGTQDPSQTPETGFCDLFLASDRPLESVSRIEFLLELKQRLDERAQETLLWLARNVEGMDENAEGHCDRVSTFAVQLGRALNLAPDQIEALSLGGVLHDMGKVAVPDEILFKKGALTPEESSILRQHPVVGEQICAPIRAFRHVLPIIRHHHERMDGSGYPDGLVGDQIPLTAQIMQVADVFDALTSNRPYRKALSPRHAFGVMHDEAGRGRMDVALVRCLEEALEQKPAPEFAGTLPSEFRQAAGLAITPGSLESALRQAVL